MRTKRQPFYFFCYTWKWFSFCAFMGWWKWWRRFKIYCLCFFMGWWVTLWSYIIFQLMFYLWNSKIKSHICHPVGWAFTEWLQIVPEISEHNPWGTIQKNQCHNIGIFKIMPRGCVQQFISPQKMIKPLPLTLKVLNFWKLTSYCSLKPLWSGMGEVVPARTSPTLHPPFPPTVHQLSWLAL